MLMKCASIFVVGITSTVTSVQSATYEVSKEHDCGREPFSVFLEKNGFNDGKHSTSHLTNRPTDDQCKTMCTNEPSCVGYLFKNQFDKDNCDFFGSIDENYIKFYAPGTCYLNKARNNGTFPPIPAPTLAPIPAPTPAPIPAPTPA